MCNNFVALSYQAINWTCGQSGLQLGALSADQAPSHNGVEGGTVRGEQQTDTEGTLSPGSCRCWVPVASISQPRGLHTLQNLGNCSSCGRLTLGASRTPGAGRLQQMPFSWESKRLYMFSSERSTMHQHPRVLCSLSLRRFCFSSQINTLCCRKTYGTCRSLRNMTRCIHKGPLAMERQHCNLSALKRLEIKRSAQGPREVFHQENRPGRILPDHVNACMQPKAEIPKYRRIM